MQSGIRSVLVVIDFGSGVPLNRQVADSLRKRIAEGVWLPGALLPREIDLAHEYGVGVDTLRIAFAALRSEGVIVKGGPGRRSSVAPRPERRDLWLRSNSRVVFRVPTLAERHELGIPEGVAIAEIYHRGEWRIVRGDEVELVTE